MLQINTIGQTNPMKTARILAKLNIAVDISSSRIVLQEEISDEVLDKLLEYIPINNFQNYTSDDVFSANSITTVETRDIDETSSTNESTSSIAEKNNANVEDQSISCLEPAASDTSLVSINTQEYDLKYSRVERGEIYWCDFGKPYGHEQGFLRPALIIQNDIGNKQSTNTIVIPITTCNSHSMSTHYELNMSDVSLSERKNFNQLISNHSVLMAEHIYTIDKKRLRKYITRVSSDFMNVVEEKINISLSLEDHDKIVPKVETKTVYVEKPVKDEDKVCVDEQISTSSTSRDINMKQIELLTLADPAMLLEVSQSKLSRESKVNKIFELFNLDMSQKGMEYVLTAVLTAPKGQHYNMETLCALIAEDFPDVDANEIKRQIVARLKQGLKFKSSPAIDFIRLVSSLIWKGVSLWKE